MQKVLEMGKKSATGSFQLFVGVSASTITMAVGTVILARLMTPEEYGLYSVSLIPSYMVVLFRDWGVNSAITRYTASLRAENKTENLREIVTAGLFFEVAMGIILSLALISISGYIASTVFQRPESSSLIAITSLTIFAGALLTASQSSFVGFERMELNSLTTVSQAVAKTVLSPILVFIGYSALGAVLGYTVSYLAASIIGFAILYQAIFKKLQVKNPQKPSMSETLCKMLRYGVPLSISSVLTGFLAQFYAFLMAIYCADAMIGNFQAASHFATILTFFTFPISTVLFPVFSKINPKSEKELLQKVFTSSVKYSALVLVPATMAIMVLSKPIISTLFGEKWTYAPTFLALYVISNLFVIFGNLSLGSLLTGLGETKFLMKLSLITLMFGIPMAVFLIPKMGIIGLIITSLVASVPSMIIGLYWIWRCYEVKVELKKSGKILLTSTAAALTTLLILAFVSSLDVVELALGAATFLTVYLVLTPAVGAVSPEDIQNLKIMFSDLGIIFKLLNFPLIIMEKISKKRNTKLKLH